MVFTYAVENLGSDTIPARAYDVEFYVDGELVSFDRAPPLPLDLGMPATYSKDAGYFDFKPMRSGRVKYRLVLDPGNRLAEADESNNVVEGYVEVQPR